MIEQRTDEWFSARLGDVTASRVSDVVAKIKTGWGASRQKYKDDPDFAMIGIDLDEPLDKVISFGETVGVTYPLALDPRGTIFYQFAEKKAGVTRNILCDRDGKIIMLTRLFDQEEFDHMKAEIGKQLEN